jgi:ABC-type lipoprotein export system ATPase subunit
MIHARGLCKTFNSHGRTLPVLDEVSVEIEHATITALLGRSGSGKTTLLQILGLLQRPDGGSLTIAGTDVLALDDDGAARFREAHIGFVFQAMNLLPHLNALENVVLPGSGPRRATTARAEELLETVGLSHRLRHRPSELSAGEQQRVALARALMNEPELVLADEPTGNLDAETEEGLLGLFSELRRLGHTLLIVTHSRTVADFADVVQTMASESTSATQN